MRSVFDELDSARKGELEFSSFRDGARLSFTSAKGALTEPELLELFEAIDSGNYGSITAIEFEEFFAEHSSPKRRQKSTPGRRSAVPPSKSAVDSLRRKFRAAAYTKGGVNWRALFDFYDRNNRGVSSQTEGSARTEQPRPLSAR